MHIAPVGFLRKTIYFLRWPAFLAVLVISLLWFIKTGSLFFNDAARQTYVRAGSIDASGRPLINLPDRLKNKYDQDSIMKAWDDALIRQQLYVFDGENFSAFNGMEGIDFGAAEGGGRSLLAGREKNLVANGSFESGSWQPRVVDCNEHDKNGSIGMSLDAGEKTDGKRSLALLAARHTACVFTAIPLSGAGDYLLTFDYQSPNAKEAEFFFSFNDRERTAIDQKIAIAGTGWQTYSGKIAVPEGATAAVFYLYAASVDGKTNVIDRYDNVYFGKLAPLAAVGRSPNGLSVIKNKDGSWGIEAAAGPWPLWWFIVGLLVYGALLVTCLWYFGAIGRLLEMLRSSESKYSKIILFIAEDVRRRPWFLVMALLAGLAALWWAGAAAGALWTLLLLFLLYGWDDWFIAVLAVASVVACLLLLWAGRDALAERAAIGAFYFLAMTVILGIAERLRHPERFHDDKNE